MSETTKSRPRPYIEQRPGNQILASDWNDMQVQIREEIAAVMAEAESLRQELATLRALREQLAEEVTALQSEIATAKLSVAGDVGVGGSVKVQGDVESQGKLTVQGDIESKGRFRGAGARFGELCLGAAERGDIEYPYESIQLRPENNLRICFGESERYVFHNSGIAVAPVLKVQSLWIGDFLLDSADSWLRILGPNNSLRAQFHAGGTMEVHQPGGRWAFQTDGNLVRYGSKATPWSKGPGW